MKQPLPGKGFLFHFGVCVCPKTRQQLCQGKYIKIGMKLCYHQLNLFVEKATTAALSFRLVNPSVLQISVRRSPRDCVDRGMKEKSS